MTQATFASQDMIPSAERPIPMVGRRDLTVERVDFQGKPSFVLKDPVGLKYHRLRTEQYRVWQLLDGRRGLEDLRMALRLEFPDLNLRLTDIQSLVSDLHQAGVVHTIRPGQGAASLGKARLERRKKLKQTLKNFMFLRLPGWDPERVLTGMMPFVSWFFHPLAVLLTWLFVGSAWIGLAINFDAFSRELPAFEQFFSWPNVLYMWVTLACCKIIHEFGHGLSCKYFGSECHEMGVMFLVFSPCLYCDVTDSWMLKNKWKRIAIAAAGIYIEVVLSAIALYVWFFTNDGLLRMLALNVFFITTVTTVIFNMNPLMRFDGYYMLSDFLEIPNLRQKADKLLREKFGWYCLGIEPRHDPFMPETGIAGFVAFAIAAWAYRWFVMFGIAMFLYTWLKPYQLQSIGAALAVAAIVGAILAPGIALYKMISAPRGEPLSRLKIAGTCAAFALLAAALFFIPLPLGVHAPFLVDSADAQSVYVTTPGDLAKVHVRLDEVVAAGTLLAELENPPLTSELHKLLARQATEQERLRAVSQLRDDAQMLLAQGSIAALEEQIQDLRARLAGLQIRAPIAGRVIAPEQRTPPAQGDDNTTLAQWHGSPLDTTNQGAFLEEGTPLLVLVPPAPQREIEATLLIDQADRNDVHEGQAVELRFDQLPRRTFATKIESFATRHLDVAPPALAGKYGGPLATVTDAQGRERLADPAYQATVLWRPTPDVRLVPGMRGTARLDARDRTAAQWLWRTLRQTFYFRL